MKRSTNASRLLGYLEGELSASDSAIVRELLANSADERRNLEELRSVRAMLLAARVVPDDVDLVDDVHRRRRERQRAREAVRTRIARWSAILASAAVMALSVENVWTHAGKRPESSEFHAKSSRRDSIQDWAGVQAYRVDGGAPKRIGSEIVATDGLLFGYTNLGVEPFDFLMIFARSETGQVFWFYPAYERLDTDPVSIAIKPGQAEVPLPDVIRHQFERGSLTIYCLFSRAPLHVSEIERSLDATSGSLRLPRADTRLKVIETRVRP